MTRSVDCILEGRVVAEPLCDVTTKPAASQPCHSQECLGVWVLGEWSQVPSWPPPLSFHLPPLFCWIWTIIVMIQIKQK